MCYQAQHTALRAIVGKLQYITGVRPDLMFVTKCLSYKLGSRTLADLTRAKKALRYLKGKRDMKLYLTIPAVKPNDLSKTLKHVTGYYDADWAGDPTTRKSTSCTLVLHGSISSDERMSRTRNCGIIQLVNRNCTRWEHCLLS